MDGHDYQNTKNPASRLKSRAVSGYLLTIFVAEAFAASKRDIDRQENRSLLKEIVPTRDEYNRCVDDLADIMGHCCPP